MIAMFRRDRNWSLGCLMGLLTIASGCAEVLESYGEAPTIEILSGPAEVTSALSATFELACTGDGECGFECALDNQQFAGCESQVTYEALEGGPHLFEARAIDAAGRSSERASWEWTIESSDDVPADTQPVLMIIGPDTLGDGVDAATLTFQFSEDVQGFEAEDISLDPAEHTVSGFTAFDANTFQATLNRSGNDAGTLTISVAPGAYTSAEGASGEGASLTITLVGDSVEIVDVEECEVPDHVELSTSPAVTTFGQPQGLIEFMMPRRPTILSHPFTTTDDPSVGGQISLGGASETSAHMRRMWISRCAGGEALARCDGGEGILGTMRWRQGETRVGCILETNTTYHFNLSYGAGSMCENASGCPAIIQHLGGW